MITPQSDPLTRALYSYDASIYQWMPQAVVKAASEEEVLEALTWARQNNLSITPRGAGTGLTGGCLGGGLIIDCSSLKKNLQITHQSVKATPGWIQDDLNRALQPYGRRLGPDTSTGDRATLGGMLANNAAGAHSLLFGSMREAIQEIEVLLATGEKITFASCSEEMWQAKCQLATAEGTIYRTAQKIRTEYKEEIIKRFPPLPRRSSGYALDSLIGPFPLNLAKVVAGSEGTLALVTSMTLKTEPLLPPSGLVLLPFNSLFSALAAVSDCLSLKPMAVELIDQHILQVGLPLYPIATLPPSTEALLIVEAPLERLEDFQGIMLRDPIQIQQVWAMRKASLGLLLSKRSYSRAIAFLEDMAVPPPCLAAFIAAFVEILQRHNKEAGIYGHAGHGCLHIRPYIDIRDSQEIKTMQTIMRQAAELVVSMGGSLSGEHGDGLIRSWLYDTLFGPKICEAFQLLKQAFDPSRRMNPYKIVQPLPLETKITPPAQAYNAFLTLPEGGFELGVDLCNGNGFCRKQQGLMCPSFQVTHEEKDSPRGRARAFQAFLRGQIPSKALKPAFDLCLQCKGCAKECPSHVDVASLKSEWLFQEGASSPWRWLFGHLDLTQEWLQPFFWLYNPLAQRLFNKPPPLLASSRFTEMAKSLLQPKGETVFLIPDTYTEFHHPQTGLDAIVILNALGFHVQVLPYRCCGRPAFSKGYLPRAKVLAKKLLEEIPEGKKAIQLEPSCLSLLNNDSIALGLTSRSIEGLDAFLWRHRDRIPRKWQGPPVAWHRHCHTQALGPEAPEALFSYLQAEQIELPKGCCGMAGSFGYEYPTLAKQIYALSLAPAIAQASGSCLIADGTSCRSQIGPQAEPLATALRRHLFF